MKYSISNQKIEVIVAELGEEYKDLLIEHLLDEMNEVDADQINPSDLIRLDVMTKANLRDSKKVSKQNRMLSMISLLGIMYALLGLMLMMWSELQSAIRYNVTMQISILLIFIGLFVALFALFFKSMIRFRPRHFQNKSHEVAPYEIVNKWKEIEALINQITPESDQLSLASMITNLAEGKILSQEDTDIIIKLLKLRNQIVHYHDKCYDFSQSELRSLLLQTDKIIAKMKKII